MNFKMKFHIPALAAALFCCLACVETNSMLGGSFVPATETYSFYTAEFPLDSIYVKMADQLSGYSDSRITFGAIREDEFGLTTRASAVTLIPLFDKTKTFSIGNNPKFLSFHFAAALDTLSVLDASQENILQNVRVYELTEALDPAEDGDCNSTVEHGDKLITKGLPVYNGSDSLSFDFSEEFGKKFLTLTSDDLSSMKKYLAKFPGIYLETDIPDGNSGRINMMDVQLTYDPDYTAILGNYATLYYSAEFGGVRKDTSLTFYYGATDLYDLDSLFKSYNGTFPQYALNLTGQQTRGRTGAAEDEIWIEGGGGLKPVISARRLKKQVEEAISKVGNPKDAVINKATLVFPFDFPEDYEQMEFWPYRLSPTCRITRDDYTSFMGLTDASSSDENQGDVDRSLLQYAPDITYHMQEVLEIDETQTGKASTKDLIAGNYDIWLLPMAREEQTTVTVADKDTQEMLNYLAYSSYYNSMYGGYGGYGGYGYGSGYGSYYSNYLNYAMMAQMYGQAQTSTSYVVKLDIDRFYQVHMPGPESSGKVPVVRLTFALPDEQ